MLVKIKEKFGKIFIEFDCTVFEIPMYQFIMRHPVYAILIIFTVLFTLVGNFQTAKSGLLASFNFFKFSHRDVANWMAFQMYYAISCTNITYF